MQGSYLKIESSNPSPQPELTALWEDDNGLEVPAKDQADKRRLARVALLGTKVWFCVYTKRGETVRITASDELEIMKKNVTGAKAKISAEEFDQLADSGSDEIDRYLDWENARRPALEIKRTTLDLPARLLNKIDRAAALRGVTRQSLIKVWLHERVESEPEAALKEESR